MVINHKSDLMYPPQIHPCNVVAVAGLHWAEHISQPTLKFEV